MKPCVMSQSLSKSHKVIKDKITVPWSQSLARMLCGMMHFLTLALSFGMCSAAMLRSKAATVQHASELRDVNPELVKMNESVGMLLSGSHGPGAAEVAAQLQDLLENTLRRRCSEQKRLCKTSCQLTIHGASPVAMLHCRPLR